MKLTNSSLLESPLLLESLIMLSIPLVILCTLSSLRLEVISTLGNGCVWVWVLEIRSLLLSLWRLLRMLSALLLARLLRWTLWVLFDMVDWVDSFWDSFSRERVSHGEGMVHEAWGECYCMCMSDSCRTLMSWRVWWTRLLMISSARRLSTKCDDCVCLLIVMMISMVSRDTCILTLFQQTHQNTG